MALVCNLLLVKKSKSQNVDEFTGNFSYGMPLLNVPSPHGPGVTISAGYGAGIGVNQPASEIGLGWGINMGGAITRSVSGIPDDWNGVEVADPQNAGFSSQGGVMYFNNHTNSDNMDFYKSTYKIDTPAFYFPDYDYYSVSGPSIGGSLQPHLFDFATTRLNVFKGTNLPVVQYEMDDTHQFDKKLQFNFSGDYAGNFKSRHYSATPINSGTTLRYPGYNDSVSDDEYSGSTIPYTGIDGVGYNQTTNRLASAKYVEYFTNTEINYFNSFMNIPVSSARSGTDYEMEQIGAFRITDESGFVYYYTIPVYINSATFGNYPLNNDYSIKNYSSSDTTRTTDGDYNYYIQDNNLTDTYPFMVEWKQNKKYAYSWLLTAVTGPDYIDSDENGVVNSADKGYWVSYDWQLWASNFIKRTPEYGFNYSFSADENDATQDMAIDNPDKVSGKFGTFSKFDQEIYYLNKIQTSSHTAIVVRDIRLDEHSSEPSAYDNQQALIYNMQNDNSTTKTTNYGTLYDDGTVTTNYGENKDLEVTIAPTGATSITIRFNLFDFANDNGDVLYIKDASNNILETYSYANRPSEESITFNYSTIKINEVTNNNGVVGPGFRMGWIAKHPVVVPQLKVNRIVLFKNEDFATLRTVAYSSSYHLSNSESAFDISTVNKNKFYNETWYNHVDNKTNIETASLQTVEFNFDYSLAKKYTGNIRTLVCSTDKQCTPSDVAIGTKVETADYASSGKLTLNEITTYQVGYEQTTPSVIFNYDKAVLSKNPDYSPIKIDYSGFYKSDASAQGYSSYTTEASKDYTDAWSMRSIKSPMGGDMDIEYESNEYVKVFNGNGGFRGPSKMYMINDISLPTSNEYGEDWGYKLEESATVPSDFTSLKNSAPVGTVKHVFIPFADHDNDLKYVNSGTFTFSGAELTGIQNFYIADFANPTNYLTAYSPDDILDENDLKYTGNGYIHFDLPIGTSVYGGGIRVKSITTRNETSGATDAYVQEYSYSGGVTPMEFDRFGEEKLGNLYYTPDHINIKLRPATYDKHRMGPSIGYTNVTVSNKGQNNIANGATTYTFITSDAGIDNFDTNIQIRAEEANHCVCTGETCDGSQCSEDPCEGLYIDTAYIIEVVDKFNGYWGQAESIQTTDINENILTLTKNNYTNSEQGALVENYDFVTIKENYLAGDPIEGLPGSPPGTGGGHPSGYTSTCNQHHHIVCIKRHYPVILSSQTVYSQGMSSTTEYLAFDDITGTTTEVRTTSPNESIVVSRTTPAFRISEYASMGPKSVNASNANILSPVAATTSIVDSTLSGTSNFANYSIQTFKDDFKVRKYDAGTSSFINDMESNLYWIADKSYNWAGAAGSLDNYGLFKKSELTAAPFDYSLASIDSKWRFASENNLLDNDGHILEIKSFNNRFSAKKYGYNNRLVIAEASNVNYSSFTYSGFESDDGMPSGFIDGEIKLNDALQSTDVTAHTGGYVLKVPSGTTFAETEAPIYSAKYYSSDANKGLQKGRTYRASVWVHSSSDDDATLSASFPGATTVVVAKSATTNITVGDWIQMNIDITVSATPTDGDLLTVYLESPNGNAFFDDLRVHPVDASMATTVYESATNRIVAKLDANNFATVYKYDAGGRVLEIWQEIEGKGLKRMKKYQYNYARTF